MPDDTSAARKMREVDRYDIAEETIGIPLDSLWFFERDVYEKFLVRILEVVKRPEWAEYDRYVESDSRTTAGPWLNEFCSAYKQCLQFAVAELAELLARWVTANYHKGHPVDGERILEVSFLFAEELSDRKFAKAWLAFVAGRTKGRELSMVRIPMAVASDCISVRGSMERLEIFMPDPDALGGEIAGRFLRAMVNPMWKDWARRTAIQKINVCAHLAPKQVGTKAHSPIKAPPPTWEEIKRRPSFSAKDAADFLQVTTKTIRNYCRSRKLDRSAKGRVINNEKFEREYSQKHSPQGIN